MLRKVRVVVPNDAGEITVVVADDTSDIRELIKLTLDLEGGFDVVAEAEDGVEAVQMVENHRPDVILLDLSMPLMDGFEAIPVIKERCPQTKILVFSGLDESSMRSEALETGADGFVPKGTDSDLLVASVRALLQG